MKIIITFLCLISFCSAQVEQAMLDTYATIAYKTYSKAKLEADLLHELVNTFTARPSAEGLELAKEQWIKSRFPYSQSEVFRFYNGPIDDDLGFEGAINAWPIDEAFLDYVEGDRTTGIINKPNKFRDLRVKTMFEYNGQGGEHDICTGYHAIEFLLWGQDFYADSAGKRSYTDYTTAPNAHRRKDALKSITKLLVNHLGSLVTHWEPKNTKNYRHKFTTDSPEKSLSKILTGMAMLSGFELASERLAVAYDTQLQEDEHSCFSDTTHLDLFYNIKGIQNIWLGEFESYQKTGMAEYTKGINPELTARISSGLDQCLQLAQAIPTPFDQAVLGKDSDQGRIAILACIEALESLNRDLLTFGQKAKLNVIMSSP